MGVVPNGSRKPRMPGREKCEEVAALLGLPLSRTVKSIVLAVDEREPVKDGAQDFAAAPRIVDTAIWLLLVRGDHELNEVKAGKVPGLAGFLLGRAVIVPGDYSRRDALVLASQRALPMVATAVVLLIVAGLIEGLISASTATLTTRLAVSSGSALFLAIYLSVGWVASRRMVGARP